MPTCLTTMSGHSRKFFFQILQMTTVIHLGPSLFDIHSCKKCIAVTCAGKFLFFTLFILI